MPKTKTSRIQETTVALAVILLVTCVNLEGRSFAFPDPQEAQNSKALQSSGSIHSARALPYGRATNDSVYLGAWLNGNMPDIYDEWVNTTGKGLAICATMAALEPEVPVPNNGSYALTLTTRLTDALPWLRQGLYGAVCLTWMTTFSCEPQDTGPNGAAFQCTKGVANGTYDNVIRENAEWIKNHFPYPLILRVNSEFDIPTISGWGKDPAVFVKAWRRIVDIFREENVQNVEWCWSPNFESEASTLFANYYPGDNYVDCIGITMYANNWRKNADQMLNARGIQGQNPICPYQFAVDHCKPFMIAEWGLNLTKGMTDEQNAAWLASMFEIVEKYTNIRMMIHWGNSEWFLLNNPTAVQVYKTHVSNPNYSSHYP